MFKRYNVVVLPTSIALMMKESAACFWSADSKPSITLARDGKALVSCAVPGLVVTGPLLASFLFCFYIL